MNKVMIIASVIAALIAIYPFITSIVTVSELKGEYIPKWDKIPPPEKQELYEKSMKLSRDVNNTLKILLEIGAVIIVILAVIEYIKFYRLYKEEREERGEKS